MRDKCIASGNRYFEAGKYRQASILYRRSLQFDPKYAEAYYRLGIADLKLNLMGDAVHSFQRACDLDPGNEDAAVHLATIYLTAYLANPKLNQRGLGEARIMVDRILRRNPKSYDGLRLDADLASANGERAHAIARLKEANQVKPWQSETIMALMQLLTNSGDPQAAEELGMQFLQHKKDYGPAYDLLFAMKLRESKFDEAEALLKTKIANLPSDRLARLQLATFYFARERRPEMLAVLDQMRADSQNLPQVYGLIGDFYVRIGDLDSAIQAYREGEKRDAKVGPLYEKRIAQVLITEGRTQEAMQILEKLRKQNPKDNEVAAVQAALLARGTPQQLQQAIEQLESLVSKEPGNAIIQFSLGAAYAAKGDRPSLDKAFQHLEASAQASPDFLPSKLVLAKVQLARGENRSAVEITEEILRSSPGNLQAHLTHAGGLASMGETKRAREELAAIVRARKDANEARFQLARLDFSEGRFPEAEAGFVELIRNGDTRGITGLAKCKEAQGQQAAALDLLNKELAKLPDRDDYRLAIVDVEFNAKRYDQARAHLEELARKRPDSADLLLRLGDVDNLLGDKQAALQSFQKAHQLNPKDLRAALGFAVMLDATGQTQQATAAYEEVLRIDSENWQALNNLAYIKANQGVDLDQALGYAQRALRQSPQNPNLSDTLALIYIRKKLSGPAVQVLRELVSKNPDNPSFRMHLGMALFDAGDRAQAKKELETALRHKPSAAEQTQIRELVARIG